MKKFEKIEYFMNGFIDFWNNRKKPKFFLGG